MQKILSKKIAFTQQSNSNFLDFFVDNFKNFMMAGKKENWYAIFVSSIGLAKLYLFLKLMKLWNLKVIM